MGACSPSVGRGHPIARDKESGAKKPVLNIHTHFVTSLIYYYSPNCLDSLPNEHSKPKFLCPINSSQILLFLCVKSIKDAYSGHLVGPIFYENSVFMH